MVIEEVDFAEPSNKLSSAAVEPTFVPPMSSVVTEISPATVNNPLASVIKSVSEVCPIVAPSIATLSTVNAVNVPNEVILVCAAVWIVPVRLPSIFATKVPVVTVKLPVEEAVAVVVPI